MITKIELRRDYAAKCWTARFHGWRTAFDPAERFPLPFTVEADLYQVAYAMRARHPKAEITNTVDGRTYTISFVK